MRTLGYAAVIGAMLLSAVPQQAKADESQAFVTEVSGGATICRMSGARAPAVIGNELAVGDSVRVDSGRTVLIYVSGRCVAVEGGGLHVVRQEQGHPSPLMGRIRNTLGEIVGPQDAAQRPVVHGMARELTGLSGAQPANTRLRDADFEFRWDGLQEVARYGFTLSTATGEVVAEMEIQGTRLAASEFDLSPGRRYLWKVEESGSFLPRGSGQGWILVLPPEEADAVGAALAGIDSQYEGQTRLVLKLATLFQEELYYEAAVLLEERAVAGELTHAERAALTAAYVRMERWDRLPPAAPDSTAAPGE